MIAISASCAKNEIVEKDMQDSEPIHVKASIEGGTRVEMAQQGEGDQISLKLNWAQSGETFDVVDSEGLVVMKFRQTEDENDDPSEFVGEYTQSGNALKGVSGEYSVVYPSNDNVVYQSQTGTLSDSKVKMRGTYSGSLEKISSVTFVEHLTAIIKLKFSTKDSDIETQDINTVIVNGFPAGEIKMTELNNEEIFIYVPPTKVGETIFYRIITSNSTTYKGSKDLTKVVEAGKYYEASIEVSELSVQIYDSSVESEDPDVGEGTEANPYIISSPGELKWLVDSSDDGILSAHYQLNTDIEIECQYWTFGLQKPFAGVFDGNGHTISGDITAYTDSPVAGFIAQNAGVIKDLEVAANVHGSGKAGITMSIGGVPTTLPAAGVGAVAGVNLGIIEGCVSSGEVSSEAIEDVDGALSGVGGIVGANLGNISGCSNSAEVTGASTNAQCADAWSAASGIAGITGGGIIENCANTGVINAPKVESGYSIAAGVVGYGQRMPDNLVVRNCTNSGEIKGCTEDGNDHAKTAGIVGFITDIMDSGSGYTNGGSKIENCQNDGPIIGGGGSGSAMTGGIAAETYMVDIEGCVNNASATVTAGDTPHEHGWCYVGGIVGFFAGDNDICYFLNNTPDLKTSLSECVNNAKITGASYAGYQIIGGIAGEVRNGHVDVCSSHNYGAIDLNGSVHNGSTYAGGITGRHVAGRASVYKCINDGAITGAKTGNSTYGGICGDNASWEKVNGEKYKDRVFDCINYGKMLLPSEPAPGAKYNRGGIVGYNNNANPNENTIEDWPEVCTCCKDNSGSTDENGDPLPLIAQGNTVLVICEGCSNPSHQ